MSSVGPGRHPSFDITKFSVEHQRVLRRLENLFHLTRHGEVSLGATSIYQYALIKPTSFVKSLLHSDREILIVFSAYKDFQPRTLDAFEKAFAELEDFRVEKVVRILVSDDLQIAAKLTTLFASTPDAPVIIPYHHSELTLSTPDNSIFQRIRDFTFSRDLFSMSSPLRSDLYFYGRSSLINEICAKLSVGENFGLFGLRRSGKTSIVHGVSRAIESRNGHSLIVDCSSPAVHQRRWNELLYYIVDQFRQTYSLSISLRSEEKYTVRDAATFFLADMRTIKGKLKVDFVAILFDEIERVSPGSASSAHWNDDRDFLLFWQSVRSGFQSDSAPYTFLIVGTNPSAVERSKIFESDNPLFGNVERRYIPMFTPQQTKEMVNDIGAVMGVEFDEHSHSRLFEDFGGHPFLTRYACSSIANAERARPILVDRTVYAHGVVQFKAESNAYVSSVVDMVRENYNDEYEMMKLLSLRQSDDFEALAASEPSIVEHLAGYGLVTTGRKAHYFRIGIVESYFIAQAKPTVFLTQEDRRTEISRKRNEIESAMRGMVRRCFEVHFTRTKRVSELLKSVSTERRERLVTVPWDRLLSPGESPLFFTDLENIISGNWNLFQNIIEMSKEELRYHISTANRARVDAHSTDISDEDFEKARVSLRELQGVFVEEDCAGRQRMPQTPKKDQQIQWLDFLVASKPRTRLQQCASTSQVRFWPAESQKSPAIAGLSGTL